MTDDKSIIVEPHPHHVKIVCDGHTLADSHRSLLLIESYAPDIYVPFEDIRMEHMTCSDKQTSCVRKGNASYWTVQLENAELVNAMWTYEAPLPACSAIADHAAFDFNKIDTYIDGILVRGHVRDPHKRITTERLDGHLVMELDGEVVAETDACLLLHETGLPTRHYIPVTDVAHKFLTPSHRQSVCTYKGEAIYYHVKVSERLAENAVWSYPDPWLDFSPDLGNIAGYLALYATAFDRVLIDGEPMVLDDATRNTDAHMLASPTIDSTLAAKLGVATKIDS